MSEDDVKQAFEAEEDSYCVFHHVQVIDENEQISFWSEKPGVVSLWNLDGTRVGEITYTNDNN